MKNGSACSAVPWRHGRRKYTKNTTDQELDRQISSRAADCARRVLGGGHKGPGTLKGRSGGFKGAEADPLKNGRISG